jgi:uncharacterized protein (DUF1684 family)
VSKNPFIPIAIIVVGIIIFYSIFTRKNTANNAQENSLNTKENILKMRQEKDVFFKTSEKSPILEKDTFKKLNYFDYNNDYVVKAHIHVLPKKDTIYIASSKGEKEPYLKYANAHFDLQGKKCEVIILQQVGILRKNPFLLAFKDATSGKTTYGGGRYIDILPLTLKNEEYINIDFNKAYFPYCAYNPNYICPIPPKQNNLDIKIEAGEKN